MSRLPSSDEDILRVLDHIHSLGGIAFRAQIDGGEVDKLLQLGLIRKVWIGNYALTEKGKRAQKSRQVIE